MTSFASHALVATDRPGRYGKQLMNHMARKVAASWDEQALTGHVEFADAAAAADLSVGDGGLALDLTAVDAAALERFEWVLGIHLIRFGARDGLECHWIRADGSQGTAQTPADLEEDAQK